MCIVPEAYQDDEARVEALVRGWALAGTVRACCAKAPFAGAAYHPATGNLLMVEEGAGVDTHIPTSSGPESEPMARRSATI